ncbi:MAG: hypothetical protein R3C61_12610 [Bacteroidia bacterium]
MGFSIAWHRLFSINIDHGYFLNQGIRDFLSLSAEEQAKVRNNYSPTSFIQVVPSPETALVMRGRKFLLRQDKAGFFVGIQVESAASGAGVYRPQIRLEPGLRLTFFLYPLSPEFYNYTALPLSNDRNGCYYFSNRANQAVSGINYLSLPVPAFQASKAYAAGDTCLSSGLIQEAIRKTGPGPKVAADWRDLPAGQPAFASGADRVLAINGKVELGLPSGTSGPVTFNLVKPGTAEPVFQKTIAPPTQGKVTILLNGVSSGRYDLRVLNASGTAIETSVSGPCYVLGEMTSPIPFGIVEIFHLPQAELGSYALASGADQDLLSPEYVLSLRNRYTTWRYIFNREQPYTDVQLGELVRDGGADEKKRFFTRNPLPLTRSLVQVKMFNTDTLLPNPGPQIITPDPSDHQLFSEIYINS